MKGLITTEVVSRGIGNIWNAVFLKGYDAGASVLNGFYLGIAWLAVLPNINRAIVLHGLPKASLTFFLFASKSCKDYNGDGNGYSFHKTQNINKALNSKAR